MAHTITSGSQTGADPAFMTTEDGVKFVKSPSAFRQIMEIPEYRFDDIRTDDRVIDIGANVGAFCIRAARYTSRVVAVEPVTTGILRENIRLNDVNIRVIDGALGKGTMQEIQWDDCKRTVQTYPLGRLIALAGGCDFLKCDCEGAEWQINPKDLAGIRRLEMELHLPPVSGPPNPELLEYIGRHYDFEIERQACHGPLGLMGFLHAEKRG